MRSLPALTTIVALKWDFCSIEPSIVDPADPLPHPKCSNEENPVYRSGHWPGMPTMPPLAACPEDVGSARGRFQPAGAAGDSRAERFAVRMVSGSAVGPVRLGKGGKSMAGRTLRLLLSAASLCVTVRAQNPVWDSYFKGQEAALRAYEAAARMAAEEQESRLEREGFELQQRDFARQTAKVAEPTTPSDSLRSLKERAAQGDAEAQLNLSVAYAKGQGVAKDDAEAQRWLRKAAEQGNAMAQYGLGAAYYQGLVGISRDYKEAVRWLRLSADQGSAGAQFLLGNLYWQGLGLTKDDSEAV